MLRSQSLITQQSTRSTCCHNGRQSYTKCCQVTPALLKHVKTTTMPLDNNLNKIITNTAFKITLKIKFKLKMWMLGNLWFSIWDEGFIPCVRRRQSVSWTIVTMDLKLLNPIHAFKGCKTLKWHFGSSGHKLQELGTGSLIKRAQCTPEPLDLKTCFNTRLFHNSTTAYIKLQKVARRNKYYITYNETPTTFMFETPLCYDSII